MIRELENLVLISFRLAEEKYRRELAGVRRYAKSRGWRVVTVEPGRESQPGFEEFLAGLHPAGCIVECSASFANPPPRIGGAIPTVYLDSPSRIPWRRAYAKYADNEAALPFDQHWLLACVAPRALLVVGFDNPWFDPKGEFLSCRAASPAWELHGLPGLPGGDFPAPYDTSRVGPRLGYVRRGGAHGFSALDWHWALDFAERAF